MKLCYLCGTTIFSKVQLEYHNSICFNSINVKPTKPFIRLK